MLLRCICEVEFADFNLELGWLWIAALMEGAHYFSWCLSPIVNLLQ